MLKKVTEQRARQLYLVCMINSKKEIALQLTKETEKANKKYVFDSRVKHDHL